MRKGCRRRRLLEHFNESLPPPFARSSNCCDNCLASLLSPAAQKSTEDEEEKIDVTENARLILKSIADCQGYYGLGVPCSVLKGLNDKTVKSYLKELDIFGKGKHRTKGYWMALGRAMAAEGYVDEKNIRGSRGSETGGGSFSFTAYQISKKGEEFLESHRPELIKISPTNELREVITTTVPKSNLAASLSTRPPTSATATEQVRRRSDPDRVLLEALLTEVRLTLAKDINVAPYMVFSEETLSQLAVSLLYFCFSRLFTNQ